jgi:norsolorinic acid ketoreductase
VIANAGISSYFGPALTTPPSAMTEHFNINVVAPLLLFQATQPLLLNSINGPPKFVTISSGAGSISGIETLKVENTAYGSSKAALNFVTRRIHAENEGLVVFPLNPGWLRTDVSPPPRAPSSAFPHCPSNPFHSPPCLTNQKPPVPAYSPHQKHETNLSIMKKQLGNHAASSSGLAQAPVSVEDGVKGIIKVIDEATREKTSGRFMSAQGGEIPW